MSLSGPDLETLKQFAPFVQAQRIFNRWMDDPAAIGDLANKIILATLQFGTASTLDPLEVKLQNYLTVLETLYTPDLVDANEGHRKAARRLSVSFAENGRRAFRDEVNRLYRIRRRPVHYGERSLRGQDVVTADDVRSAQHIAYRAVMYALDRAAVFKTHSAFLDALDKETSTVSPGTRKIAFVTWRDAGTELFHAVVPLFPGVRVEGKLTADEAYREARSQVDAEIQQRVNTGKSVPEDTVKTQVKPVTLPSRNT